MQKKYLHPFKYEVNANNKPKTDQQTRLNFLKKNGGVMIFRKFYVKFKDYDVLSSMFSDGYLIKMTYGTFKKVGLGFYSNFTAYSENDMLLISKDLFLSKASKYPQAVDEFTTLHRAMWLYGTETYTEGEILNEREFFDIFERLEDVQKEFEKIHKKF